ncbi:hypothetical protein GV791_30250 [Nocardia cyriacigeorgica]|uniref:Metalloprotease n=2 Tax=Nocardia cyriacigeorgica TaxID=135487 RepID=H6R8Q1_NOCCG|nr:neutral zinc metallopeptidase [Nocardia cyriacigeorgica]MBF6084920.1 neutral zinc metallopeptidase [Nocardia cyriacigeorgica]MBF6285497.1 neutral zinc metallopeptidase [Nocardia cyriacigeorgica]NEW36806.1 hypothetical protein [Nocardia cyriacigeorgica]CCF61079.1 conserved protein of unknown function [Nocardia cyriacigeorgica GUH-2]BDU03995.1 hypothetical protein FMUBM48_02580 [Nocardia cyriacigeorgica]
MPPPVPYGRPPGPPPRRSGGGGKVVAVLVVLVLVVVGGLVRAGVKTGIRDDASGPRPGMTYDNGETGPAKTADNPLVIDTSATLIPASCDYAPWGTGVETARAFFDSAENCLEAAWKPVLEKAGLPFQAPTVNVSATTDGITTPCTGTTSNFAAFYCPANKSIYMPISQLQTDLFGDNWVVYLSVFAHEYGHHIQNMSGILKAANSERVDSGVRSTRGLELSRRVELQANCFDGMYLSSSSQGGSLTASQMSMAREDAEHRGDQPGDMRDHGSTANGSRWFNTGVDENRTSQCNTFAAPASAVS